MIDPSNEQIARRVIQESDFSKRERAILHEVVNWSIARGREWAVFEKLDDLVELTATFRPDVSNALNALQSEQVIQKKTSRGELWIRFLPHGALVPAPLKIAEASAALVRKKLELLNSMPIGFEPSTGQRRLGFPATSEEQVDDELAANSRTAAVDARRARVSESLTDLRARVSESLTDLRESVSETLTTKQGSRPPARTSARDMFCMDVCHGTPVQDIPSITPRAGAREETGCHVPDGGGGEEKELTPAQLDLLGQIDELTSAEERAESFRKTWVKRVKKDEIASFKAIAQTRVTAREGRIRKTIGGCLNWNFNYFREAARKVRSLVWL